MSSVTPKLEISKKVISRAKRAYAARAGKPKNINLEKIYFSETLLCAVEHYLPHILKCLEEAGMRKQADLEKNRPRRISQELWERLGELTEEFDVSRVGLVRAAMTLLASEVEKRESKKKKRT